MSFGDFPRGLVAEAMWWVEQKQKYSSAQLGPEVAGSLAELQHRIYWDGGGEVEKLDKLITY